MTDQTKPPCDHCPDGHAEPESRPWGVFVASERDSDGQPTHLYVSPSNGAHVAQSDADWLWQLIRDYEPPKPSPVSAPAEDGIAGERLDETPETMLSGELRALARTHASVQPNQAAGIELVELTDEDTLREELRMAQAGARVVDQRREDEKRRADAAEAKLAETNRLLTDYQRDVVAWKRERDEARAKLDEIRDAFTDVVDFELVDHFQDNGDCIDGCPACVLSRIRTIVEPARILVERTTTEATR